MHKNKLLILSIFLGVSITTFSQELRPPFIKNQITLGTNFLSYVNFLTINAEASMSVDRNWSINVQGKINPFTFNKGKDNQAQSRQATISAGARWWPWHVNSAWFYGASAQYTTYNHGGFFGKETYEGSAYGLNINFGYALILNARWNLEFGAGLYSGYTNYTKYACPNCGKIKGQGKKFFVSPNNILVQIVHIF